jgi:flavin-dependent dehydrogenase
VRRDTLIAGAPLIIGAGPAGTAAAITLGEAGHRPVVLERTNEPADKVCGDFLSVDAIQGIRTLGVDPLALGAAPIHRMRLIRGARIAETALPFPAMGLSRRILDHALLRRTQDAGAVVRRGQTVRRIDRVQAGWMVQVGDADPIAAADVFLATGKHDLRARPRPGSEHGAIGMKMYYDLLPQQTERLAGAIELILFPGGYAGLQCVEDGRTVVCIAVRRRRLQDAGGNWPGLLASIAATTPHLGEVLAGATALLPRPLAVAGIPYGLLHRPNGGEPDRSDGLFRLGDQAAVIPSLTGDGIAIALHSGTRAAQVWLGGGNALAYHGKLARTLGGQMRLAGLLHGAGLFGPLQPAAVRGAALFPGLLRAAARGTRIASD